MSKLLAEFDFEDICIQYFLDEKSGMVSLELVPVSLKSRRQPKKLKIDPFVQVMIRGDDFPFGFANGHTMRGSGSLQRFHYNSQKKVRCENSTKIITVLSSDDGQVITHTLTHYDGEKGIEAFTEYCNNGSDTITLDMLSSFSLSGITPFIAGDAPESTVLHRLRSKWSNEARLESRLIEDLQLEPSWSGHGAYSEKFGQLGSMPVRRFFPFAAIEDRINHVLWGVQLACPSSWQIEVYRRDDGLSISGGLSDYDFGHWSKNIKPGKSFSTPVAFLSVCDGDVDMLCNRLTSMQNRALENMDFPDKLPVVFNEFCTTWGSPSHRNIKRILNIIKGRDIDYFVIDAGWYADENNGWEMNMGDWEVNQSQFPDGLEPVAREIQKAGMKPGIWFEAEICGRLAKVFKKEEYLLTRYGKPITAGNRRFWDLRNTWVNKYLDERVIKLLKNCGFEYIKIDYNESIGIGCDGAESLGEGLRESVVASTAFLKRIREQIPGIVVENCSSGGHRLEPSLLGICQLASFSDAHEEREIPIIAANLHRAMLPRQSLVWAVLRKDDTPQRLVWSLSATFLGVMCLSGDVYDLDLEQWKYVDKAIAFYRTVSHIIQDGTTVRHGPKVSSYRHPKGWQAVERTSLDESEKLIIAHVFDECVTDIKLKLNEPYKIKATFSEDQTQVSCIDDTLSIELSNGACAVYLQEIL